MRVKKQIGLHTKIRTKKQAQKSITKKGENGITLIALVVTIVVLLILAGVTITMVLGEDGIIAQAKLAAEKTKEAEAKQEEDLANLVEQLDKILEEEPTPTEPTSTPTPVSGTTADDLLEEDSIADIYGDYVDYGIDLDDNPSTYDWRIFYVGEGEANGQTANHIYLIAADYVPNTCKELTEAKGQTKANMTQNSSSGWSKCTSYWESTTSATYHCNDGHNKSLNSGNPQCSFPELFTPYPTEGGHCANHYYCSDHVGNGGTNGDANSRCASALQCTGNWSSFKNGASNGQNEDSKYVDYAIGGPSLEMWVESWDQKHGDSAGGKTIYANGKGSTGYYVGVEGTSTTTTYYNLSSATTGYNDTLYFPHKQYQNINLFNTSSPDSNGDASCYGYWLGSPSAGLSSGLMDVSYGGYVGNYNYDNNCGVRPVVCLKSNVKLTEKEDAPEGTTVWDLNM